MSDLRGAVAALVKELAAIREELHALRQSQQMGTRIVYVPQPAFYPTYQPTPYWYGNHYGQNYGGQGSTTLTCQPIQVQGQL